MTVVKRKEKIRHRTFKTPLYELIKGFLFISILSRAIKSRALNWFVKRPQIYALKAKTTAIRLLKSIAQCSCKIFLASHPVNKISTRYEPLKDNAVDVYIT